MAGVGDLEDLIAKLEPLKDGLGREDLARLPDRGPKVLRRGVRVSGRLPDVGGSGLEQNVAAGLDQYAAEIKAAQAAAVEQVGKTFTTLCNVHLYGNEEGSGASVFEALAIRARELRP